MALQCRTLYSPFGRPQCCTLKVQLHSQYIAGAQSTEHMERMQHESCDNFSKNADFAVKRASSERMSSSRIPSSSASVRTCVSNAEGCSKNALT
jgi:hypothetical protein